VCAWLPDCCHQGEQMRRSALLAMALLAACATTSTGIVPTGTGEYSLSKTDMRDEETILASLYVRAFAFCNDKHLSLEKVAQETQDGQFLVRNASATLRFRCVH
jgi:hypothetical protein